MKTRCTKTGLRNRALNEARALLKANPDMLATDLSDETYEHVAAVICVTEADAEVIEDAVADVMMEAE